MNILVCNLLFSLIPSCFLAKERRLFHKVFHSFCEFFWLPVLASLIEDFLL